MITLSTFILYIISKNFNILIFFMFFIRLDKAIIIFDI